MSGQRSSPSAGPHSGSPDGEGGAPSRTRLWVLFGALALALLLSELDQTIFATALPTIVGDLGGVDGMLWVTTAWTRMIIPPPPRPCTARAAISVAMSVDSPPSTEPAMKIRSPVISSGLRPSRSLRWP